MLLIFMFKNIPEVSGQFPHDSNNIKQDTILYNRLKILQQPDTINYQFLKSLKKGELASDISDYIDFMIKISDTSKYIITPLDKFKETINPKKIIIGLRHDVDISLDAALKLSVIEKNFGIRASYYILHTASYYLANPNNMAVHCESIIPVLKIMQDEYHHEIGWHNDLITLQLVYNIDPLSFFHQELDWLRNNGLNIKGTASHGSNYCYDFKYLNFYFFQDYKKPIVGQFVNNDSAFVSNQWTKIKHASLKEFGLDYEAYFLNNNKYYSDAAFINGTRWNVNMLNLKTLLPGDRIIILLHPLYYPPNGSSLSELISFSLIGQLRSVINPDSATVLVKMPKGIKLNNLNAVFSISPKARAMIGSKELYSSLNSIDFTDPVNIKVISEDGLSCKNWLVSVVNAELKLSLDRISIGATINSSATFEIRSNTSWSIISGEDWLTANFEQGEGNEKIILTAQANPAPFTRLATIKVSGEGIPDQFVSVIQDAGEKGKGDISSSPISVYPNPAHTILFIKGLTQNAMISIFDQNGKIIFNNNVEGNILDISNLFNGIYYIKITNNGVTSTVKFVKE
jgi:hypothetical protein